MGNGSMPNRDPKKRREYMAAWAVANRGKIQGYERIRRANGGEARKKVVREASRKHAWRAAGIPVPTRPEPEWCECCGRFLEKTPHNDHDHTTGEFRGWLCSSCNMAIGLLGDSIEGVKKALAYLIKAR